MLILGIWCDNIIIQVVVNVYNCVIYIIEFDNNKLDGIIIIFVVY